MNTPKTWHANAGVVANAIETGAVILAGVGGTLVDILFTAGSRIPLDAVAGEGAFGVDALTAVFTRVGTDATLISIDVAGAASVARRTVAVEHPTDGVGVTLGAFPTGITDTGIFEVAQQSCLSVGAETDKRRNPVDTRGASTARCRGAVVDVLRAVGSAPAIHTHTLIAADQIAAGPSVLAGVWLQAALVHIFRAVLACPLWRALAVIGVHPIYTGASVGTLMPGAVVNVVLTVGPIETWKAVT